jgi:hypothetical protein
MAGITEEGAVAKIVTNGSGRTFTFHVGEKRKIGCWLPDPESVVNGYRAGAEVEIVGSGTDRGDGRDGQRVRVRFACGMECDWLPYDLLSLTEKQAG